MRKTALLLWTVLLLAVFASIADAAVVYQNGQAVIQSGSNSLKDIKDSNYLTIIDKVCFLKKPIRVASTGELIVSNSSCEVVNMYADSSITVYGKIQFNNVRITSYDPATGQPIELSRTNYKKIRPDIVTRSSAQYFSAKNSEFAYLGYYNATSSHWGVALRFLPAAYIVNSKFHHNYFGIYTFDSDHVTIKNSESSDNLEYGVNIHDFSDYLYLYNNTVFRNGNHGIILSKFNDHARVIRNTVFDHTQNAFVKGVVKSYGTHGIMLHQQSNNALVSGNELIHNRVGIKLDDSHHNTIKSNKVTSDLEQGFYIDESSDNEFQYNQVIAPAGYSLYSFNSFYNYYTKNKWGNASNTIYVRIDDEEGIHRFLFSALGADVKLNELSHPSSTTATGTITDIETTQNIKNDKELEREAVNNIKNYEESARKKMEIR